MQKMKAIMGVLHVQELGQSLQAQRAKASLQKFSLPSPRLPSAPFLFPLKCLRKELFLDRSRTKYEIPSAPNRFVTTKQRRKLNATYVKCRNNPSLHYRAEIYLQATSQLNISKIKVPPPYPGFSHHRLSSLH